MLFACVCCLRVYMPRYIAYVSQTMVCIWQTHTKGFLMNSITGYYSFLLAIPPKSYSYFLGVPGEFHF